MAAEYCGGIKILIKKSSVVIGFKQLIEFNQLKNARDFCEKQKPLAFFVALNIGYGFFSVTITV